MSKPVRKKRKLNILKVALLTFAFALLIAFGTTVGILVAYMKDLPEWSPQDFEAYMTSFVYDSKGNVITKLHKSENRTPVELKDMPEYLIDAFIVTEDVRFMSHPGVDIKRIGGAVIADIRHRGFSQGASTITMQLVRNAILESQEKKMERKIKEALLALQVERHFTKEEILYFYLNEIYFGHGANGVQAAAQTYFDKNVSDLTLGEAAMLTGVIRNPRIYSPFLRPENAIKVRNTVLNNLVRYEKISEEEAEAAKNEELKLADMKKRENYAYPWFTDYVIDQAEDMIKVAGYDASQLYTGGFRIYTTMDPKIQRAAEEIYNKKEFFPDSTTADLVQSSMVVMDPKTGEVKAIIGGREHVTKRGLNRATAMTRQPGSAIKPLTVYAPALEKGYSPATIIDDVPVSFGSGKEPWTPQNYDGKYRGLINLREALQWSVNIVAVKLLNEVGISDAFNFGKKLGLPLTDTDKNLAALSLGGMHKGVAPLDLAAAYAAFANQGVYIEPHVITKIVDHKGNTIVDFKPKKVIAMSEQTAFLMTDMLKTVVDAGTGTRARLNNRPVAGKTGTTQLPPDNPAFKNVKGNRDAWFAAYTPELVGVVWMGYDREKDAEGKIQYLQQVYGGRYPAQIWKAVMEKSLKNVPVSTFVQPPDIVVKAVDVKSGKLPSDLTPDSYIVNELFAKKNVPTTTSNVWVVADIDPETKLLANEFCSTKISGVFLKRPEPYLVTGGKIPLDAHLEAPSSSCTKHTANTVSLTTVKICTDPRHGNKPILANVSKIPGMGGCPTEFVKSQTMPTTAVPSKTCALDEHRTFSDFDSGTESAPSVYPPDQVSFTVTQTDAGLEVSLVWKDKNGPGVAYKIERWLETSPEEIFTDKTPNTSYIDKKIQPNTVYYYRIYAVDDETRTISDPTKNIKVSTSGI